MSQQEDDEIDLAELLFALWSGKFWIATTTVLAGVLAVFYALSAPVEYESTAIFELKKQSSGPRLPSEFSGLAALAGINSGGDSQGVFDRLNGRDFVGRLATEMDLAADPFFNPPKAPSVVKDAIKFVLSGGGTDAQQDPPVDPLDAIFENYLKNVAVSETKNGSISLVVTHEKPDRAAAIANGIAAQVINELDAERQKEQRAQLDYLSGELGQALVEMDRTKRAVADYALANSLGAPGEFAQRSQLMVSLREDLLRTKEMKQAVEALTNVMTASTAPQMRDYLNLRDQVPVLDDVDFRRLIGVPEALGSWEWPPLSRLRDFSTTLEDRVARITRSVAELREEAEKYAVATEELGKLERSAKIAEATYGVLIEQVKAQALSAGYQSDTAKLYQSAAPAPRPSAPKKPLIVALGLVLGVFIGVAIVLVGNMRRGVLFSKGAISTAVGGAASLRAPSLSRVRGAAPKAIERLAADRSSDLAELSLEIARRAQAPILVGASGPKINALPTGIWAARMMTQSTESQNGTAPPVGLLLLGETVPHGLQFDRSAEPGLLQATQGGVRFFTPADGVPLSQLLVGRVLSALLAGGGSLGHSGLVVAASSANTVLAARALAESNPVSIVVTQPGKTQRAVLERASMLLSWDANVSVGR